MLRKSERLPNAGKQGIGLRRLLPGAPDIPRAALHAVYDALVAAADFFALRNKHQDGFAFDDRPGDVPGV